jgi:hypothetical protein
MADTSEDASCGETYYDEAGVSKRNRMKAVGRGAV